MAIGGTTSYDGETGLPDLVRRALAVARGQGFDHSCRPQQGRLLAVLAGGRAGGRVGETGTGCGVGLAWMVSAATTDTTFVSIEADEQRARASAALFADHRNVTIVHGDWTELKQHAPFDLLVLDGGGKGKDDGERPLDPDDGWLTPGGAVVLDDFTPAMSADAPLHDPARHYWLSHPALHATEIRLAADLATIVGVSRWR